jgi:hypothetical protein
MMGNLRRPSPALIVASLALAFATSGTAFAVTSGSAPRITSNTVSTNGLTSAAATGLTWAAIILKTDWTGATRTPSAAIDGNKIVHLRGAVVNKSGKGGTTIGQLPSSASPSVNIPMTAHTAAGGAIGIIIQRSTGLIILQRTLAPGVYVGLEGITYAK